LVDWLKPFTKNVLSLIKKPLLLKSNGIIHLIEKIIVDLPETFDYEVSQKNKFLIQYLIIIISIMAISIF
jgi:hypothetical protein